MSFTYDPRDADNCQPAGTYEAVIKNAVETTSKSSGNEMLAVTWEVYGPRKTTFDEYFTHGNLWKLRQLCEAVGVDFDAGEIAAADLLDKSALLELDEEQDDFGKKNRVHRYAKLAKKPAQVAEEEETPF